MYFYSDRLLFLILHMQMLSFNLARHIISIIMWFQKTLNEVLGYGLSISEIKKITLESELLTLDMEKYPYMTTYQVFRKNFLRRIRDRGAQYMGEGTGRIVYAISPRFAIKVSITDPAFRQTQNFNEVNLYTSLPSEVKNVFTKIYAVDDYYRWIITDLVKPFKDKRQLNKFIGLESYNLDFNIMKLCELISRFTISKNKNEIFDIVLNSINKNQVKVNINYLQDIFNKLIFPIAHAIALTKVKDLHSQNLGYTADHRLVILDSGF